MRKKHDTFFPNWNGNCQVSGSPKKANLKKVLKKCDLFGYPIELNFDEKGSAYQTPIGGFLSISLLFLLLLLVIYKLVLMTRGEASSI